MIVFDKNNIGNWYKPQNKVIENNTLEYIQKILGLLIDRFILHISHCLRNAFVELKSIFNSHFCLNPKLKALRIFFDSRYLLRLEYSHSYYLNYSNICLTASIPHYLNIRIRLFMRIQVSIRIFDYSWLFECYFYLLYLFIYYIIITKRFFLQFV